MDIQVLTAATATNSEPTLATQGFDIRNAQPGTSYTCVVKSTAGSGTMTVTLKAWGYSSAAACWVPLGIGAAADDKGLLNGGNPIAEGPIADNIRHAEVIGNLDAFDRFYMEVHAIGGTSTAVSVWLTGG